VVFVSQEDGSDDIWFIGADGQSQHSLVRNTWEWDKSPTWSPNGSQIAFWSNRTGLKQIFVMNADGKEVHNISNTGWDESEPLWVR
jgi:TolB protein